jgi:2-oxoglutarate ferredoxin oxidoreductase subunit delta
MAYGRVSIDEDRCKGCALCTVACVPGVLSLAADHFNTHGYRPVVLIDPDGHCTGCGLCAVSCPDVCLTVYRTVVTPRPASQRGASARKGHPG